MPHSRAPFPCLLQQLIPGQDSPGFGAPVGIFMQMLGISVASQRFSLILWILPSTTPRSSRRSWQTGSCGKRKLSLCLPCIFLGIFSLFFQQKMGVSAVPSGKALFLVFFCVPSRWLGKGIEINPCAEHSEAELFRSIPSLHSHMDTPFLALPLATSTWRF